MTLRELAISKGFTIEELTSFGVRNGARSVEIPYFLADGSEYRTRIRDSKDDGKGFKWDEQETKALIPYGLNQPVPIKRWVYVVEGESDCWALWLAGVPAIGLPGATSDKCLRPEHLGSATDVVVIEEPDEAGARFAYSVPQRLHFCGFKGNIASIRLPGFKDARAAFQADRSALKRILTQAWKDRKSYKPPTPTAPDDDQLLTYDDLCRMTTERVEWAIEGLLAASGILLLAGRAGSGKSVIGRNLASSVASGRDFLGRRCRQGPVIYVGLEDPVRDLQEHLGLLGASELPIFFRVTQFHGDQAAWLRRKVELVKPALVVIDTIGAFANIENICDYSQVERATAPLLDLRTRFGTSFLLNHHTNGAGTVYGGAAWERVPDAILVLTGTGDEERFLKSAKMRGNAVFEPTVVRFDRETGSIVSSESKFMADKRKAEQRILDLATAEPLTRETLARRAGGPISVARAAVDSLNTAGLLSCRGTGAKGDPRLYTPPANRSIEERPKSSDSSTDPYIVEETDESKKIITLRPKNDRPTTKQTEETEPTALTEETEEEINAAFDRGGDLLGYAREKGL